MKVLQSLLKWVVFSVALALLPIVSNYLFRRIVMKPVTLEDLVSHGELLLVAAALVGRALGEVMVGVRQKHPLMRLFAGGGCVLVALMASMLFAYISGTTISQYVMDTSEIRNVSLVVYVSAFVTSGAAIVHSEM